MNPEQWLSLKWNGGSTMSDRWLNQSKIIHAGIIDYSKHIKYVENNEEIAYIFKIPKNGKYQCYVYNCSDFKTQLLGEIEILND